MSKTLLTLATLGLLVAGLPTASAEAARDPIVLDAGRLELCPENNPAAVLNYCIIIGTTPVTVDAPAPNPDPETQEFCVTGPICPDVPKAGDLIVEQPVTVGVPTPERTDVFANPHAVVDQVCFQTDLC